MCIGSRCNRAVRQGLPAVQEAIQFMLGQCPDLHGESKQRGVRLEHELDVGTLARQGEEVAMDAVEGAEPKPVRTYGVVRCPDDAEAPFDCSGDGPLPL